MTCCHDLDRTCGRPHATSVQSNASGISQLDQYTLKEMKASERLDYFITFRSGLLLNRLSFQSWKSKIQIQIWFII